MKKKFITLLLYLVVILAIIVSYNYWSYSCGYCNRASLLSFSKPALMLILVNVLAIMTLVVCKIRNRNILRRQQCGCGGKMRDIWTYCPECGEKRGVS